MTAYAHSPPEGDPDWSHAHRLEDHLRAVGELAAEFAAPFGLAEVARLAGRWHDLGKATPAFQAYIQGKGPQTSHKLGGTIATRRPPGLWKDLLALIIAGHHSGLPRPSGEHPSLETLQKQAEIEWAGIQDWLTEHPEFRHTTNLPEIPPFSCRSFPQY